MEDLVSKAKEIAGNVASREELLPFLRVCAENKHLSLTNQLLVYEQNPEAKTVCGRSAWEQLGRKVKNDAVTIQILFPELKPGQNVEYRVVKVFDYDSTEGSVLKERYGKFALADRITQLTKATWEIVPEAALNDSLDKGFYDKERNVFCLSETCTMEQQEQSVLSLYMEYVSGCIGIQDRLVKMASSFVVYERLGLKHTIVGALFGKVGRLASDEKWEFLKCVWWMSKRVLDDLEGVSLTFNEIAIINSMLTTDVPEEVQRILEQAAEYVMDEELREELGILKEKLMRTREGYLTELYQKRCRMQLFTYPPVLLELEHNDYLREERRNYDAKHGNITEA